MRENIFKLENENQQLKRKDEISRMEIERLRQECMSWKE